MNFTGNKPSVVKGSAKTLVRYLAKKGVTVTHAMALEAMAAMSGYKDWNALLAALTNDEAASREVPVIGDIPFDKVHSVVRDGMPFSVAWRYDEVLKKLAQGEQSEEEETALDLHREEDFLVYQETVTLEDLQALVWSKKQNAFVSPNGSVWRFFVESEFGVTPEPKEPSSKQKPQSIKKTKYRLFSGTLFFESEDGEKSILGTAVRAVLKGKELRDYLMSEFWDDRLSSASCKPAFDFEELDSHEAGPYQVLVDGGHYDTMESFSKAIEVAQFMAEEAAASRVSVQASSGAEIWSQDLV